MTPTIRPGSVLYMTTNLWDKLSAAYPALRTQVGGESPLKHAVDEFAAGRCATKVTKTDLAKDEKECV